MSHQALVALHLLPYIVSLFMSVGVALYAGLRRTVRGTAPFTWMVMSQAFWTLGYIFELVSPSLSDKIFFDRLQYFGTVGWGLAFVAFALQFTGRSFPKAAWAGLFALVLIYMGLVFTNEYHRLVYVDLAVIAGEPFGELTYRFGIMAQAMYFVFAGLLLFGLLILMRRLGRPHRLYRAQLGTIIVGMLIPFAGMTLALMNVSFTFHRDVTPFTFGISDLIMAVGLFRYRLFDVVPLGRDLVIDNMEDVVIAIDAENRVVDANPSALRQLGRSGEDTIGRPASEVFSSWPDLIRRYKMMEDARHEFTLGEGDQAKHFDLRIMPLRGPDEALLGRLVITRDVTSHKRAEQMLWQAHNELELHVHERTRELSEANEKLIRESHERQQAEAALRQAQKMEAVGRLAGGVAHDFNNHLMVILNHAELLGLGFPPDDPRRRQLDLIKTAAEQSAALTRQLLALSRKQILEPRVIDLNQTLRNLEKVLGPLTGESIQLGLKLQPGPAWVTVDPVQIEQVIINLAVNARDAMPDGGKLLLETSIVDLDADYAQAHPPIVPGRFVMLAVSDTGIGMDPDTQARIFEPFFTTKEQGRGTGLGLAIVYGIVRQCGGDVFVYSEPGRGACFKIYLPLAAPASTAESRPPAAPTPRPPPPHPGAATIMLIEDNDSVRELTAMILEQQGHTVIPFSHPEPALARFEQDPGPIDLVITDIVLPGMSGPDLAVRLLALRPNLHLLYVSGYTDHFLAHGQVLPPSVHFLAKPFTLDTLTRKVHEILASVPEGREGNSPAL